jgi:lysophospholipase L1-like esterase
MNGDVSYFYDGYHPNDAGAREMATIVAGWFADHPFPESHDKH